MFVLSVFGASVSMGDAIASGYGIECAEYMRLNGFSVKNKR